MPARLRRYYGADHLHFETFSCYQRRPVLGTPRRRDGFLEIFEQVRKRFRFVVVGYVVMPEHVHLLIGEPERGDPSIVLQVLKQRFGRWLRRDRQRRRRPAQQTFWEGELGVWQRRFYDFVVWSRKKRLEKLRYIHQNPVKRGLVLEPQQWRWSSYRDYAYGQAGPVLVNEQKPAVMKVTGKAAELMRESKAG